jgi:tetratricopeptide (TPR) repeat protein
MSRTLKKDEKFGVLYELKDELPEEFKPNMLILPKTIIEEKTLKKDRKYWENLSSNYFNAGKTAYEKKDYKTAINEFTKNLSLHANLYGEDDIGLSNIFFSLGSAFLGEQNYHRARDCYGTAARILKASELTSPKTFSVALKKERIKMEYYQAFSAKKYMDLDETTECLNNLLIYANETPMVTTKESPYIEKSVTLLLSMKNKNKI